MLRADNDTFRLSAVDASDTGKIRWSMVRVADIAAKVLDESMEPMLRQFYLAAAALTSGEAHQRRYVERMTTAGTRNIRLGVHTAAEYVEETLHPNDWRERRRQRRHEEKNGIFDMEFQNITMMLNDLLATIKTELGFPEGGDPAAYTYTLTDEVIDLVEDADCQRYLRGIKVGRLLTIPQLEKVKARINHDCPANAAEIIAEIEATASREHLSAVSLNTTRDGQMVVNIVNVRGDLLALEAAKLLMLLRRKGEPLSLGQLDNRGGWMPDPLVKFGNHKVGEVLAMYTANDSVLHAACRREVTNNHGGVRHEPLDKAEFVIDQTFLLCLHVTLTQLREQAERFQRLREQAEVKVALNVGNIFDPTYFYEEGNDE